MICSQYNCDIDNNKTIFNDQSWRVTRKKEKNYAACCIDNSIYIYYICSLFENCNSVENKTSLIIRSYPEVDMWAPVVLQEYGMLQAYLFRL